MAMAMASTATVDGVVGEEPIPTTSAILMVSSKHISTKCRIENMSFLNCKKKDQNPEKCLDQGQEVTRCVLSLLKGLHHSCTKEMDAYAGCFMESIAKMVPLKDIVPAAQNIINTQFILLEKDRFSKEGQEKTCLALVADETASVHFQFWGTECDAFEPGDIIRLTKGIFSYNRNNLILRAGKRGKTEKIGEFTMAFVETPNLSEIRWVPDPCNSNKLVQDAVVSRYSRIFQPWH